MFEINPDISEIKLNDTFPDILKILLIDRSTSKPSRMRNIIWANDNYAHINPKKYGPEVQMTVESITTNLGDLIKPRALKSSEVQKERSELNPKNWSEV
ncbi:hypothetical protein [Weissella confusa]|uniref:hypothetical protein n=1 Tax=Weissella confusa TaxID=1583 RepID=UPI000B352BCF|nr:hypothetical protein [Weissella confusa]